LGIEPVDTRAPACFTGKLCTCIPLVALNIPGDGARDTKPAGLAAVAGFPA
jgi:hypothetical protein